MTVTTTWDPYDQIDGTATANDKAQGSIVQVRVQHTFKPLLAVFLVPEIPLVSTAEMTIAN